VVAFDDVGGVNYPPDLQGVLEEGGNLRPVVPPGPVSDEKSGYMLVMDTTPSP
jgi:hypothetical protein